MGDVHAEIRLIAIDFLTKPNGYGGLNNINGLLRSYLPQLDINWIYFAPYKIQLLRYIVNFKCDGKCVNNIKFDGNTYSVNITFYGANLSGNFTRGLVAFGYCMRLCLFVCPCVNTELVTRKTYHLFKLEPSNSDKKCKTFYLRSLEVWRATELDFQYEIKLKSHIGIYLDRLMVHILNHLPVYWSRQPRVFRRLMSLLYTMIKKVGA